MEQAQLSDSSALVSVLRALPIYEVHTTPPVRDQGSTSLVVYGAREEKDPYKSSLPTWT